MPPELHATELILLGLGVLLLASVVAGRFSSRSGVPVLLLFLAIGMLAGSEGIGGVRFADHRLALRVGMVALVLILFDGGLRTPASVVQTGLAPAAVLAVFGVVITAGIMGVGAHALGFSWTQGLLLGAIVSPTDAAAVFSVLRGGGVRLDERVGAVIELESGLNDPTAVLLTVALVTAGAGGAPPQLGPLALGIVLQLAIGAVCGVALGLGARASVRRLRSPVGSLYPVLTAALAFLAFGATSLLHGSGFLAVYVTGVVLGNAKLPAQRGLFRVHDFMAWVGQIAMFVLLGLLASPSDILAESKPGVLLDVLLALIARPLAVAVCLAPFRFRLREIVLVAWVGLRGAVPIILAVIPVLAGVEEAGHIFDVVFFVVLLGTLLQGSTVRPMTRWLGLGTEEGPTPVAVVDIESRFPLEEEILSFLIRRPSAVCGAKVADIPFPDRSSLMLIVRGGTLVAPKGEIVLGEGDHVFVFCRGEDASLVRLLFGRAEE